MKARKPPPLMPWWFVVMIIAFLVAGKMFDQRSGPNTARERIEQAR